MPSQNSIAGHAIDLLGESAISDINDSDPIAMRLLAAWEDTRDATLRRHWWKFAIQRESLAALSTAPEWGFSKQYQIEGNVVRTIQVDQYYNLANTADFINSDSSPYRIEGDKILTDIAAPLKVRWIVNDVDVGLWDALFAKVMACDLADRISIRFTGSETVKARIKAERVDALKEAVRINAIEQPPTQRADSSWLASRLAV